MSPRAAYVFKEITKRLDLFPLCMSNALEQDLTDIADLYYYGKDCVVCGTHVSGQAMYMNHSRQTVCKTCHDKDWRPVREVRPELFDSTGKCCHCGQYGKRQSACNYCGAPIS